MEMAKVIGGQCVPRPVRDLGAFYGVKPESSKFAARAFSGVTLGRLLLASCAGGAIHYYGAPRWAAYGATALISLPAAVALGASELAYCGFKCVSRDPCLLAASALAFGGSWLLFENYDRLNLNQYGYRKLHLVPTLTISKRCQVFGDQVVQAAGHNVSWLSPNFWGMGLGESASSSLILWLANRSSADS